MGHPADIFVSSFDIMVYFLCIFKGFRKILRKIHKIFLAPGKAFLIGENQHSSGPLPDEKRGNEGIIMAKKPVRTDERGFRRFGMRDCLAYAAGDLGCNMSFALKSTMASR